MARLIHLEDDTVIIETDGLTDVEIEEQYGSPVVDSLLLRDEEDDLTLRNFPTDRSLNAYGY